MRIRRPLLGATVLPCFLFAAVLTAAPPRQPRSNVQQPPAYKSGVTIVPLDVRVLDKDGRPITDLKQGEFRILENGVPQTIAHFMAQALADEAPQPGLRASPNAGSFDATPQSRRVFLFVLGRGALGDTRSHPETLNALLRFIRESLLPQDQVGLIAYNRAVNFTTDHEKVARILESFRGAAAGARSALARQGSLAAADVGSVFADPPALDTSPSIEAELGLEDYVKARRGQSQGEIDALIAGINYLRYVVGEKHLVFVTASGPTPTWDQVKSLTSSASHARVALDTIQTGERVVDMDIPTSAVPPPRAQSPAAGPAQTGSTAGPRPPGEFGGAGDQIGERLIDGGLLPLGPRTTGNPLEGAAFIYDLRYLAEQTGGQSSILKDAAQTLARIDTATRVQYLLAYYPTNGDWNGRYRPVKVEVTRPGAKVLYRHGYYARREADVFDRRRIVSNSRIEAAGYQLDPAREIEVAFTPRFVKAESGRGGQVVMTVRVDASRMAWGTDLTGRRTASLEIAVYCGDGSQKIVGQARRQLNIALTEASYEKAAREGFLRDVGVAVTGQPRYVKVVVYDYEADRVGSAMVKLK